MPSPKEAAELWTELRQQFATSRQRIADCRKWLNNQVHPSIPEGFTSAQNIEIMLPTPVTVPLHTVQVLGRKRPYLKREPVGEGLAAMRKSTQIELWANAGLEHLEKQGGPLWLPMVDGLFNHGEVALLCYPTPAHWEKFPEFTDSEGTIKPRFQRDKDGRDAEDDYYTDNPRRIFKPNAKTSQKAYDAYQADFKARRIPITARVVTAEECLPVFGPGYRLDGLLVLSEYSVLDLERKGYQWLGGPGHPGQGEPEGATGPSEKRALLEFWQPGRVSYFVAQPGLTAPEDAGHANRIPALRHVAETWRKNDDGSEGEAEIDLAREYGIERLPALYLYGPHWAAEKDPNLRAVPFLFPFLNIFGGLNNILTAKAAHAWKYGFGGHVIEYVPGAPMELAMENGQPRSIKIEPMTAQYVAGRLAPTVNQGTGPDVDEIISLSLGSVREEGPSPAAFGGPGASSGHERSLIRSHLEEAQAHVLESGRQGWEFLGEMLLECGTAIARHKDFPDSVPVYASVKGKQSGEGHSRKAIELTESLCDDVFDVSAYYRRQKGENLPWAQVMYEWWRGGAIPHTQFLEDGLGDEEPEDTLVELAVEAMLLKTEQGQQQLYEEAARETQDRALQELFKLQQEGRITADGTPTAALAQPGKPSGSGVQMGNPVRAAVAGQISGAMGTASAVRDVQAAAQSSGPVQGG